MGQHHGWIYWIVIGLFAGGLAKMLTPGESKESKGCLMTVLLGICGSVLVGFIMRSVFHDRGGGGFLGTLCGATIGSVLIIMLTRKLWSNAA